MRLIDLDHPDAGDGQEARAASAVGRGGLDAHGTDDPESTQPVQQLAIASPSSLKFLVTEPSTVCVEGYRMMSFKVAIHATDDARLVFRHTEVVVSSP